MTAHFNISNKFIHCTCKNALKITSVQALIIFRSCIVHIIRPYAFPKRFGNYFPSFSYCTPSLQPAVFMYMYMYMYV